MKKQFKNVSRTHVSSSGFLNEALRNSNKCIENHYAESSRYNFNLFLKKRIETTRADKKVLISNQKDLVQSLKIPLK